MQCPKCGKRVSSTVPVCKHCGKRLARPKTETKPKLPYLAQVSTNKLIIGGVGLLILIALLLTILTREGKKEQQVTLERPSAEISIERGKTTREIGSNAVYGQVMTTHIRSTRHGTITVKSTYTGKVYTIYIGEYTGYHPQRHPSVGERITVIYRAEGDLMKATQVEMNQ